MRFIDEMEGLVSSQVNVIKIGLSMTRMEAKLAMLSVYPLIINVCMLLVILVSTWLTVMGILGYELMQVFDSMILAMSGILIVNVLVLGLLCRCLLFNLKNMSFEKTRAYLSRGKDEPQKTGEECNSNIGQKISEPTEPV
jgi:hypothetical protein